MGVFPEIAYQEGLLETPFHRIYFQDSTQAVEQLPYARTKLGTAIQLNSFAGGNIVLRNKVMGYTDNFGITAWAIDHESVLKLKPFLKVLLHLRLYGQSASKYFKPC